MYKKYFSLLLFFSLLHVFCFAQNNSITNLQNELKKETNSEKIAALQLLLAAEIKQNSPDSAAILAKEGLQYYTKHKNNYQIGFANLVLSQTYTVLAQKEISKNYTSKFYQNKLNKNEEMAIDEILKKTFEDEADEILNEYYEVNFYNINIFNTKLN